MIKRNILVPVVACALMLATGCAFGPFGSIYTDVTLPVAATSNDVGTRVGESEAKSILGIIGTGDAGINEAASDAGITKISHVDQHIFTILGVYGVYTTHVYGN